MEDKRTALAILISIIIIFIYTEVVMAPYTRQHAVSPQATPAAAPISQAVAPSSPTQPAQTLTANTIPTPQRNTHPSPQEIVDGGFTTIKTKHLEIVISNLGARLKNYRLLNYKRNPGEEDAFDMVNTTEGQPLPLAVYTSGTNDDFVSYQLTGFSENVQKTETILTVADGSEASFNFTGKLSNGNTIQKIYKFNSLSYLFNLDVKLSEQSADGSRLWIEWPEFEPPSSNYNYTFKGFALLGTNNKVTQIPVEKAENGLLDYGENQWISFSDKYFMATIIPFEKGPNSKLGRTGEMLFARVGGKADGGNFSLYIGPKDYEILKKTGSQLERNIDLGWFSFLAHPLLWLIRFFYKIFGNYGLSIILLTLVIKALFLPLTQTSFKSMAAMQDLQPEMKALRERIKDPTQLNQEMMALYKKRGVNPMGGCFPILIQIPVFLGLYNALLNAIELRHAPFALWITDLSAPEHLTVFGFGIPVMVLIMGASMFVQQWMTPSAMDPMQKKIMLIMPVVFTVMFTGFPSGLVLYWLVNNTISIIQQAFIRKEGRISAVQATILASIGLFGFGYILTLI